MATNATTVFSGDPNHPQKSILVSKTTLEPLFVPWRKHQKTHSSASLNFAYGRRHSLESLSGGSLRQASIGIRSLRWRPQHPLIEKLSGVAHFHYDFVELGPIKVELLPLEKNGDSNSSTSTNRRSYHRQPAALPVLCEHPITSIDDSSRLSPEGQEGASKPLECSSSPLKESNRRVAFKILPGAGDCATSTNSKPLPTKVYTLLVHSNRQTWTIRRTYRDFVDFDKQLHRCVYDRRFSLLSELSATTASSSPLSTQFNAENTSADDAIWDTLLHYMERFSDLAGSLITCFPVLKWLELDNRGNHLVAAEDSQINIPAVAAAYAVQNYVASAPDELTLKVGDIVSVIDMPPASESVWWRGKLTILKAQYADVNIAVGDKQHHHVGKYDAQTFSSGTHFVVQVGFFPSHCVQLFGNRVNGSLPVVLRHNAAAFSRPVFRRRGKWATLLRFFLANRPSRRSLKEAGILKERVFGCDLAEHLESSGLDVPLILRKCAAAIENNGIVDGIYRGSGIISNIQRLRSEFDENRAPNLVLQDIHCIASLLKMYFREMPNPLLTFQLYGGFMDAVEGSDSSIKILRLHDVVQRLPPPHFRTAEYLIKHLARVGEHAQKTGMHFPNLALVWAPNLLRCKEVDNVRETTEMVLRNVNTQAIVVEYLIRYADIIFSRKLPTFSLSTVGGVKRRARPMSLACTSFLSPSPSKLMNLEEAKRKLLECRNEKVPPTVGLPDLTNRKCIDVNGGPSAIPPKYHTVIHLPTSRSFGKSSKFVGANIGGWRSLFNGRRIAQDDSHPSAKTACSSASVTQPSSPQISSPKLFRAMNLPQSNDERGETDSSGGKRLRHVKSAETFKPSGSGSGRFISLDSSIRQSTARRSLRVPKFCHRDEFQAEDFSWTQPEAADGLSKYLDLDPFPSLAQSTRNDAVRASLKSCKTTDIDHALGGVVSMEETPIFSFNGVREAASPSWPEGLCFETTVVPPPLSPVSEPPLECDQFSDEGDWIKNLLESNFAAIDDSICEEINAPTIVSSTSNSWKSFSAPNSLKRPEDKKYENGGDAKSESSNGIASTWFHLVSPASADASWSPAFSSVKFELPREQQSNGLVRSIAEIHLSSKSSLSCADSNGNLVREKSQSEEKVLLAELCKTPQENSPSQDDLRRLLPELDNIYNSLEEMPVAALASNSIEEGDKQRSRAASITDLEVIEMNPEWQTPLDKVTVDEKTFDENGTSGVDGNAKTTTRETQVTPVLVNSIAPNGKPNDSLLVRFDRSSHVGQEKLLKDSSTSPFCMKDGLERTHDIVDPNNRTVSVLFVDDDVQHVLANVNTVNREELIVARRMSSDKIIKRDASQSQPGAPKFISFKEANALSDRLETWHSVKSSRCDSEDEDPTCLRSIYDNVVEARALSMDPHQKKPTPMPRLKGKSSFHGEPIVNRLFKAPSANENEKVATTRIPVAHPQRPAALAVLSHNDQPKNWSSEKGELANSPLFRKQQLHLFPASSCDERNKSEPPCAESPSQGDEMERGLESMSAKSESHLARPGSSVDVTKGRHQTIAPSPRSAFSPVLPKANFCAGRDSGDIDNSDKDCDDKGTVTIAGEFGCHVENPSTQQPQPILTKATVKKSHSCDRSFAPFDVSRRLVRLTSPSADPSSPRPRNRSPPLPMSKRPAPLPRRRVAWKWAK